MNPFSIRSLSLALITLIAAPIAAQGQLSFSAVRTKSYGVTLAGGSTTMRADAAVNSSLLGATLAASASNIASVRLFGFNHEASAVVAGLNANHNLINVTALGPVFLNTSTGSYSVRLGGITVLSASSFSIGVSGNLVANVYPGNGVSYGISMLGFSVGLTGNVSARANYNLTPSVSFSPLAVNLDGPMRTSAVGSAGASVGAFGASVTTTATLTYANVNGTLHLHATPTATTGTVAYTLQQIRLLLQVTARLALPFVPVLTSTVTMFDVSTPAETVTMNLTQN